MSGKSIWKPALLEADLSAARGYLSLLMNEKEVAEAVRKLKDVAAVEHEAKDLLRASQTHLLDKDDPHVAENLKKIKKGKKIAPVLLVRGDGLAGVTLTIADGLHRVCASYHWNEKMPVACRLVYISRGATR